MINGQTLLATLEQQQTSNRRVSVWGVVGRVVLALLAVAVIGGMLAFIGYRLWLGWQTGQWDGFWMLTINGIFVAILPVFVLLPFWNPQSRLAVAIPALRQIAAAREDALTPPVIPQPLALPSESLPVNGAAIGPLKRLIAVNGNRNARIFPLVWLIFMLPFILLITGATDFELGPILPFNFDLFGNSSSIVLFPLAMIGMYAVVIGVFAVAFILRMRAGWATMTAQADAESIRWRVGGVERRIAWRDVRSFSRLATMLTNGVGAYAALSATPGVVYLLDGPDASLIWSLAPTANDSQYAASDYLCRLIISRTGLPLRDLTVVANDLAVTRGNVQRVIMMRSVMGSGATASPTLQTLALTPPPPRRRIGRRVGAVLALSLVPLLLLAAVFGYGGFVEHYQQAYFASLPQRLHSETPLFQDTLDTANYQWPVDAVTKTVHRGQRFVHGAYELYGDDPSQASWAWENSTGPFGDAAFEVSVSERGAVGSGGSDGIGLMFNVSLYGDRFSVFRIHADGSWDLYTYRSDQSEPANSWNYVDGGKSSAIHQGGGAENTLLALKRGKDVLLYVNNHFIEAYYDRDSELPFLGYVGLYLNDDAQTGDFSNVAVYPVQPPSSEWWV